MPVKDITGLREYSSASVSNVDLLKASFAVTVNGATQLMGDKYRNSNYVDKNYSINNPEVDELFTSYGVPISDKLKYIDSNNLDHLTSELEKNKLYQESTAKLGQELPIAQYPLMMATSMLDPVDLVTMPLGFKALGSIKMLQEATRTNNVLKAGISTGISATASEAMLADTHNVDTNLAFTAIASSLIGGGLGAFLPIIQKAGSIESYGKMLDELQAKPVDEAGLEDAVKRASGYDDFDHIKKGVANKIEGWKKHFVWSPSMLLFKSKNPAARAVSYHADKPSLATSSDGNIMTSNSSTAMETKQDLYGEYVTKVMKPLVDEYKNYKLQGGTEDGTSWLNGLGKQYREHIAKIQDDAWLKYDDLYSKVDKSGARETDKIYLQVTGKEGFDVKEGIVQVPDDYDDVVINHLTREIEKNYPVTNPTLKNIQNFYHSQQQIGEAVGMSALKGRNGKTYMNRMYSNEKVEKLGQAKATDILYNAMLKSNVTQRETSRLLREAMERGEDVAELEIKLKNEIKEYAQNVIGNILTKNVYNEMSFADLSGITTSTSFYKPRKLNIDERLAYDILENDIGKVTNYYSYKTAPKIALKKHLNIETSKDIDELIRTVEAEGRKLGMDSKEIAKDATNIATLIDTINGTREMSRNPNSFLDKGVRRFTKFNYVTLGGGFGLNTLSEIGTVVMTHGIKAFTKMNPAFQETLNMYKKKPTKKWTNELLGMGLAESVYRANKVQRYDDLDFFSSNGKLEDLLDKGANTMSEVSGLNFLTTFLELTSFSSSINDLLELSAKGTLSKADQKRIARLGLTPDDLQTIAKTNKVEYDENGYLLGYNFEKWTDQTVVDKVRNAMREMVKNAVIQADPTSLPAFGTSSHPMAKLFTQFMRFPLAAHERIMLKGVDEASGRMAVGAAISTAIMTMIFLLREEAMVQAGFIDERDRKYGLEDEKLTNLATALSTKMPYLGFTQPVADTFLRYSGMTNNYGRDTISSLSPTLGRVEGIGDVLQDLQDGNLNSRSASFLKYMTPFNTLPVINEGLNALVKD